MSTDNMAAKTELGEGKHDSSVSFGLMGPQGAGPTKKGRARQAEPAKAQVQTESKQAPAQHQKK